VIIEHVLLPIATADRIAFFEAFRRARAFIEVAPGFLGLSLHVPAEGDGGLLLMVQWASIADHRDGFRKSDDYQHWRALLHPFYPVLPEVHYYSVAHAESV